MGSENSASGAVAPENASQGATSSQAQASLAGAAKQLGPLAHTLGFALRKASPYIQNAFNLACNLAERAQQRHLQAPIRIAIGTALLFFGGSFALVVEAVEAFRHSGRRSLVRSAKQLYAEGIAALEESDKDDKRHDKCSISALSSEEYAHRKLGVVLRAVDPNAVADASSALFSGAAAIVATLKAKFAQAATLGASLGDIAVDFVRDYAEPRIKRNVSPEFHQWVHPTLVYVVRLIAISLAWVFARIIVGFYCASKGAELLVRNVRLSHYFSGLIYAMYIPLLVG
jgi:hypothetical protein